jgi:septal ring factor EnvC (AmiA/AmiB activator)
MKIYTVEERQRERSKNAIPEIFERIFAICKTDEHFASKDKMQDIEEQTKFINDKIKKQEDLLNKSENIKADLLSKISTLDENNLTIRSQLLESLGSEL